MGDQPVQQLLEVRARDLGAGRQNAHDARFGRALDEIGLELALVLDVGLGLAALDAEERRLRDVDVAVLDHFRQLAIEEREQQRPDVRSVHVGVGHDDDAVIPELGDVEIFRADAAAERRDHRPDLVVAEHLIEPRLLDVENLSLERQNRLEPAVASLLRRSTG